MEIVMGSRPDVIIVLEGGKIGLIASKRSEDKIAIVNRDKGVLEIHEEDGVSTMVPKGDVRLTGEGRFRTRK